MSKQQNTVDTQKNAKAQNAPRKQNGTRRPQPRPAKGSGAKKQQKLSFLWHLLPLSDLKHGESIGT